MKFRLTVSKSGLPCFRESGGGFDKTGIAVLVCGPKGEKKRPIYLPHSKPNGEQAVVPVVTGDFIVHALRSKDSQAVAFYRVLAVPEKAGEEIDAALEYSWQDGEGDVPEILSDVVDAALDKCRCQNCVHPHYVDIPDYDSDNKGEK